MRSTSYENVCSKGTSEPCSSRPSSATHLFSDENDALSSYPQHRQQLDVGIVLFACVMPGIVPVVMHRYHNVVVLQENVQEYHDPRQVLNGEMVPVWAPLLGHDEDLSAMRNTAIR